MLHLARINQSLASLGTRRVSSLRGAPRRSSVGRNQTAHSESKVRLGSNGSLGALQLRRRFAPQAVIIEVVSGVRATVSPPRPTSRQDEQACDKESA